MLRKRFTTLLLLVILTAPAAAAGLKGQRMDIGEGEIRAVRARDLNGDGLLDIVAFSDGKDGKAIRIWCARKGGAFNTRQPDVLFRPKDQGLVQLYYAALVSPIAGKPAVLLVVDRRKGIFTYAVEKSERYRLAAPVRVGDAPPLPFYPDDLRISVLDVGRDLDGDGEEELLLPSIEGYRILEVPGGKEAAAASRIVDTGSSHSLSGGSHRFLTLHWEIPLLTVADWDGDGIQDLIAGHDGRFLLFLQRKDGTFLKEARRLDLLKPAPGSKRASAFQLADVNGNGRVDLLVTRTDTNVPVMGHFSSDQWLFLNPRFFSPKPGKLGTPAPPLRTSGTSINPVLTDFDGDGDLDLVVTSLEIDLGSQIRKDVSARYRMFRFDKKKRNFESDAYFDISRSFPWEQLQRRSTAPVCFFTGDFDGDGKRDLLDIADRGNLTILKGTTDTDLFSTAAYGFTEVDGRPLYRIEVTVGNDVRILDLNLDGVSDILAYKGPHVVVIRSRP